MQSRTEDHQAIQELVHRYAWASDSREFGALAACFVPEATVTVEDLTSGGRQQVQGAQEIARWVEERHREEFAQGHRRRHLTTCFVLDEYDGRRAVARAYICVMVGIAGQLQSPAVMGFYRDEVVRGTDDAWRFQARHITIEAKARR